MQADVALSSSNGWSCARKLTVPTAFSVPLARISKSWDATQPFAGSGGMRRPRVKVRSPSAKDPVSRKRNPN